MGGHDPVTGAVQGSGQDRAGAAHSDHSHAQAGRAIRDGIGHDCSPCGPGCIQRRFLLRRRRPEPGRSGLRASSRASAAPRCSAWTDTGPGTESTYIDAKPRRRCHGPLPDPHGLRRVGTTASRLTNRPRSVTNT